MSDFKYISDKEKGEIAHPTYKNTDRKIQLEIAHQLKIIADKLNQPSKKHGYRDYD